MTSWRLSWTGILFPPFPIQRSAALRRTYIRRGTLACCSLRCVRTSYGRRCSSRCGDRRPGLARARSGSDEGSTQWYADVAGFQAAPRYLGEHGSKQERVGIAHQRDGGELPSSSSRYSAAFIPPNPPTSMTIRVRLVEGGDGGALSWP